MNKKKIVILFVSFLFLFTGCQKEEAPLESTVSNETSEVTNTIHPVSGGTLQLSMRTVLTLNPLLNEDESVDTILKLVYEPLVKIDASGKVVPSIAQSWSFSPDGKTLTMVLEDNIYWHDGERLTADDVIFSLNTIRQAEENSVYKKCIENISSFSKEGDLSLQIVFGSSYTGNLYHLCFPIIPSHVYNGENVLTSDKNMEPVGTGPYQFESYTPAKDMVLVKKDSNSYIDTIHVLITPDKDTDLYSFDQGLIDCIAAMETEMGSTSSLNNRNMYEYTTNYYDFVGFNFNQAIFQDKSVRQAFAWAMPKQSIIDGIYLGHALDAQTPVPSSSWLYEENITTYSLDLKKAQEILQNGGWTDTNGDNVREKMFEETLVPLQFSILVNEENEERKQVAKKIAEEMKAAGFDITVDIEPFDVYTTRLAEKDFDVFLGGWQFSSIPDLTFLFSSSQINNGSNYISYQSEAMDNLLSSCRNALDEEGFKQAYSNLQKYISEELPYVSIVFRKSAVFTSDKVHGDIKPLEGNIFDNIEEWFISE